MKLILCRKHMNIDEFNKNDKQANFNQVKGIIQELNDSEKYCSITLSLGHENIRPVNFSVKKEMFDLVSGDLKLGDKVCIKYFLTSTFKNGNWYTRANLLSVDNANKD